MTVKKAAKKPAPKKAASPASESEFVTYTIRTVSRATWVRFSKKLKERGSNVNWAINHFVQQVADGSYKFE